jgi:hypothetical protein
MFVQTHEVDAIGLRDGVVEAERDERRPVRLRVVHDIDRDRTAQATILRLVLSETPAELRIEAVLARVGDVDLGVRAVTALVEAGLLLKIDEYVLATTTAVELHQVPDRALQAA